MKRTNTTMLAVATAVLLSCGLSPARAAESTPTVKPPVSYLLTQVRILPKAGTAAALVGARITGSSSSSMNGFVELAKIEKAPADGQWLEVPVPTQTIYRFVKIEAAPEKLLAIAELEFISATGKLTGQSFATVPPGDDFRADVVNAHKLAFDGDTATAYESTVMDSYVGLDLKADSQASVPNFQPKGGVYAQPVKVSFTTNAHLTVRFTTDGSTPSRTHGERFARPFELSTNTSVAAIAFQDGKADSPIEVVSYLIGANQKLGEQIKTYHIGNSLTDTIRGSLDVMALSAGKNLLTYFKSIPGCSLSYNWANSGKGFGYPGWGQTYQLVGHPPEWVTRYEEVLAEKVDHLFLQPFPNPAGLHADTVSGVNFIKLAQQHNPDVQAWLYAQWICYPAVTASGKAIAPYCDQLGGRSWEKGEPEAWMPPIPNKKVKSWDDAMANAMNYYCTVLKHWNDNLPNGRKPARLCPGGSALLLLEKEIAAGKLPGVSDFGSFAFRDHIHLAPGAAYLITLVHYACIYGESPEGKVTWATSGLTKEQAQVLQRIAWETVIHEPLTGVTTAK